MFTDRKLKRRRSTTLAGFILDWILFAYTVGKEAVPTKDTDTLLEKYHDTLLTSNIEWS